MHPRRNGLDLLAVASLSAFAVVVVFVLRIGPVVLKLTDGVGVHSGDALGLVALLAALAITSRSSTPGTIRARAAEERQPRVQ